MLAILLIQSRYLGSAVVGQVSLLILNLAIIQTISDIYTGSALVYFIPKHALNNIYRTGLVWTFACISVINLIFFLFQVGVKDLWMHVLMLSFLSTLHAFHNVILLAKQKIRTYNFLVFFQPAMLLLALSVCIYALQIRTVQAFVLSAYVSWGLSLLLSSWQILQLLGGGEESLTELSPLKILRNGLVNQLGNLAHTLSNRYNYYMITSTVMVGIYASATSLIESVWILSGSVSPIILSHIANQKDADNNSRVTFLLSKICFLLSLFCVLVVLVLPENFFTALLGKDFTGTKTIMLYLSPGVLMISFSSIISHYFSGLGKQRILLFANSSGLLVTLLTSYIFISRYGLIGACYAASLSYAAQALVLTVVFMKQNQFTIPQLFSFKKDLILLRK